MHTKHCITCKERIQVTNFGKHSKSKDGLQSKCKECKRAYDRKRHAINKEHNNKRRSKNVKRRTQKLKDYLIHYMLENPCVICGESDIRCLEFDHINPETKKGNIADLVSGCSSLNTLKTEVDKCRVLCSNCHSKHSSQQRQDYKYKYWIENLNKE